METNSDDQSATQVDDKPVTEDDLRNLKYGEDGVETAQAEDEPAEAAETTETAEETEGEGDDQIEAVAGEEEAQAESTFTKEFPQIKGDTPEEYAKNLEIAYKNSSSEALRLKNLTKPEATQAEAEATLPKSIVELYAEKQMDKAIITAYNDFSKEYAEVTNPVEYDKFVKRVATLSKAFITDEQLIVEPPELYSTAAASLGWSKISEPSSKEKVGMAIKEGAATSKTSSAVKPKQVSKVTPEMIAINRKMYPGKSDAEIREELEPYIQ